MGLLLLGLLRRRRGHFRRSGLGTGSRRRRFQCGLPVCRRRVRLHRPRLYGACRHLSRCRRRTILRHARPRRRLRLSCRMGRPARLHHRRHALCVDVGRLHQPTRSGPHQLIPSVAAFPRGFGPGPRTLRAQRRRRAREHHVQRHRLGARRPQRIGHSVPRIFVCLPSAAVDPHDAVQLAVTVPVDAGHVAGDHLVRRFGVDLAGRPRDAAPRVDHPAHLGGADPDDPYLRVGLLELSARFAAVASDRQCGRPHDAVLADLSEQPRQSRQGRSAARRAGSLLWRLRRALRADTRCRAAAHFLELGSLRQLAHRLRNEHEQSPALDLPAGPRQVSDADDFDRVLLHASPSSN